MGTLLSIWKFIKNIDFRFILILLSFVLLGFGYWQWNKNKSLQAKLDTQQHNIEALKDSTRQYKTKAGKLGKEKLALQTDLQQLEIANKELHEELQKERDNVETITKIKTVVERDSVEADSQISEIGMSQYRVDWDFSESGEGWKRSLSGYVEFRFNPESMTPVQSQSFITTDQLNLSIVTGIREDDQGRKTIFVRSSYPHIDFVEINGAVIDQNEIQPEPKRWGIGPSIGYGIAADGTTALFIGVSVNFNIIRF